MELFSVERDGFCGFLHEPASGADRFAGKAIVVLGGSEGNENIPRNLGARFAEEGLAALGESEFTPISLTPSTPPKRPPAHASPRTPRG